MAVWKKIYRGGVQRTTPETREVNYTGPATTLLPGTAAVLNAANGINLQPGANSFWYVIGEQLYGSVDDNQVQPVGQQSTLRLFQPHSGDLLAMRAVAGLALVDDLALTINAQGRVATAGAEDRVFAYVDQPASASPLSPTPTTLDQLIPVKIL